MLPTEGIQCICGAMAQWTVKPDLVTYPELVSVKGIQS